MRDRTHTRVTRREFVAGPGELEIRVRVPAWLETAPDVRLNGTRLEASVAPGSYLTVRRACRAGDRMEIALPMRLRAEALPDAPQIQAFLYGPLVLAGDLGADGLTEGHIVGPNLRVGAAHVEQHGSPLGPTNRTPAIPDIDPGVPCCRPGSGHVDQAGGCGT